MVDLSSAWFPLRYHEQQSQAWRTDKRFVIIPAGRGSGKTELARRRSVLFLAKKKPWDDPIYVYALPTYAQAKRVAWKPFLRLIPKEWVKKNGINTTDMSIETIFGSTLYVAGLDKPERIEGLQIDGGVMDESCDQRPGAYERTIMPMLTHRHRPDLGEIAWFWRIGVPKRYGIGAADFKEVFEKGQKGEDPDIQSFTWSSSTVLSEEQLDALRRNLSPKDYSEQVDANWQDVGGLIFYAFSERHNVTYEAKYDKEKPIVVGSDFNVNPMAWILGHRYPDGTFNVFDELYIRNTYTQATLDELYKRYGTHPGGWEFFGDATSSARKTAASKSDYIIIKNDRRFSDKKVYYSRSNPRIADRFASCNTRFCNAKRERFLFVHPKCVNLIRDLKIRAYKENSMEPDDYGDIGHITDALGYPIYRIYPLRIQTSKAPQVLITA